MSPSEYHELIAFLSECFEAADRRADAIDRRFDAIGHRLETVDRRLAAFDDRLGPVGWRVSPADQRLGTLEQRLEGLQREVVRPRVEMFDHFDEVDRRLDRLDEEYRAIMQALQRLEILLARVAGGREMPAHSRASSGEAAARNL
jgi:chromosome segregation ATPase